MTKDMTLSELAAPRLLVIAADGGRVQTRSADPRERWKEDKIGIVYDATATPQPHVPRGEYEGAKAKQKPTWPLRPDWRPWGEVVTMWKPNAGDTPAPKIAYSWRMESASRSASSRTHFPEATFILDWAHAAEHLSDCAKPPSERGTWMPSAGLRNAGQELLWEGISDRIIADLRCLSDRLGSFDRNRFRGISAPSPPPKHTSYFPTTKPRWIIPASGRTDGPLDPGWPKALSKQFGLRMKEVRSFGMDSAHRNPASSSNGGQRNARLVCPRSLRRRPMGSPLARTRSAALMITSLPAALLMFLSCPAASS
ncbi:MAG: hypothetical protein IPN19_12865 [Elusimicrobia bacterium]|nr:hypothetical protein [Elusimicrobiota bacterium]